MKWEKTGGIRGIRVEEEKDGGNGGKKIREKKNSESVFEQVQ